MSKRDKKPPTGARGATEPTIGPESTNPGKLADPCATSAGVTEADALRAERGDVITLSSLETNLLMVTPKIVAFARGMSGVLAAVFEIVRSKKLFLHAGFDTMDDYAQAIFNLKSASARKKAAQAGRAAWACYPRECERIIATLTAEPGTFVPESLVMLPQETGLYFLEPAVNRLPEAEGKKLAADLLAGKCTSNQVKKAGRETRPVDETVKTKARNEKVVENAWRADVWGAVLAIAHAEKFMRSREPGTLAPDKVKMVREQFELLQAALACHDVDVKVGGAHEPPVSEASVANDGNDPEVAVVEPEKQDPMNAPSASV